MFYFSLEKYVSQEHLAAILLPYGAGQPECEADIGENRDKKQSPGLDKIFELPNVAGLEASSSFNIFKY